MTPDNLQLLFSAKQIDEQIARLGQEISPWAEEVFQQTGQDVLAIPVLRGAVFFFADLVRQVQSSVGLAPIRAWSYAPEQNEVQRDKVIVQMQDAAPEGRAVLLVDDICDSGRTLAHLQERFLEAGATEVRSAVLVRREIENSAFRPDWVAFHYAGPEWLAGFGMDDQERWRNLPAIYYIIGSGQGKSGEAQG